MDLIDLEDETIDAEVMNSLAVTMDDFKVGTMRTYRGQSSSFGPVTPSLICAALSCNYYMVMKYCMITVISVGT